MTARAESRGRVSGQRKELHRRPKPGSSQRRVNAVEFTGIAESLRERLFDRVALDDGDGCWEWQGSRTPVGHGRLYLRRGEVSSDFTRYEYAHRIAWLLEFGFLPWNICVLHQCDNPPCVRTSHLALGTKKRNSEERSMRGRGGTDKLLAVDIPRIRTLLGQGESKTEIARLFNVSRAAIYQIEIGSNWGWVA